MITSGEDSFHLCVIDTETSGRDPVIHGLLELALGSLDDEMNLSGLTGFFVNEGPTSDYLVQPEAMEVNGIDLERVTREGKEPLIAVTDILGFFHKAGFDDPLHQIVLVGWNVGFDWRFLERLWRLAGRESEFKQRFSYRYLDLASVAMFFNAHMGNVPIRSGAAFDFFKALPSAGMRHTARGDCIAAVNLFHAMFRYITEHFGAAVGVSEFIKTQQA